MPFLGTYVRTDLPENTPYMEICDCRSTEKGCFRSCILDEMGNAKKFSLEQNNFTESRFSET